MFLPCIKIKGSIGRWTAETGNETLPVLHAHHRIHDTGMYRYPMKTLQPRDWSKYDELIALLAGGNRAIIQKDQTVGDNDLRRAGYVGVFEYADFRVYDDRSFELKITKKIAEPRK